MTTVVALRFPTGRYHATPWDRSVNEATLEWPPSPWRILRALYATWQARAAELEEGLVLEALSGLAVAPSYRLPRHSEAHTRHYYPDTTAGTDKVFDPFACVDPEADLLVRWPASLSESGRSAVDQLCRLLPHLGRADSLCEARLLSESESRGLDAQGWCEPGDLGDLTRPAARVLAPTVPLDVAALLATTTDMRRAGRTTPAGARWLAYPASEAERRPPLAEARRPRRMAPTAIRLRLGASVLPTIHEAVTYGHVVRRAAMSKREGPSPVLSGKLEEIRREGHVHAHFLALDTDGDRLLDTAIVWAPEGLDALDVEAFGRIARLTSGAPGFRPVRTAVEAVGDIGGVAPELVGPSASWISITPFAPYRHQGKSELLDFLTAEVARELLTRGMPGLASVELKPGPWLDFERLRPGEAHGGVRPRRAYGLALGLVEPVAGPLALGALSHYGLGLFAPNPDQPPG